MYFGRVFEFIGNKINFGEKFDVPEVVYFRQQCTVASYR